MSEIIINDDNWKRQIQTAPRPTGLIPRNYGAYPVGYLGDLARPFDLPLIPRREWQSRLAELKAVRAQLSDIRERGMWGQRIPSRDQNGQGYCMHPSTLVRMADGSQKPIQSIRPLEKVLSAEGNVRRVLQCHVREYSGEMITIKAWGHGHLSATPNHSILTQRGYVPCEKLTTDDWIAVPKYVCESPLKVVQTSEHTVRSREVILASESWQSVPGRKVGTIPDFIELTPGAGRIFGMWLAEGSLKDKDCSGVIWSFGTDKKMHLVEELVGLLESEWGVNALIRPGPTPSVTNVLLLNKSWGRLFESLLGRRAEGKRLHPDVSSGSPEFLKSLFYAWMDCDGCSRSTARRKTFRRGATVSHSLAMSMYDIANHLGLCPGILKEKPQQNNAAKTRQVPWKITIIPEPGTWRPNYRAKSEAERTWRKVYEIERQQYDGLVYNIGVEIDHSYVAEGIGVKNCWAHSPTSACLLVRALQNQPYADLSAFSVACLIKNYRDQGGWGAEALQWIAENGIATSETWPQQSMSPLNDTTLMRIESSTHKVTEWMDGTPRDIDQLVTCLLLNIPVVSDFNWWGHSVCSMDLVDVDPARLPGSLRTRIWNSWGDGWGEHGTGILEGTKAIPDGQIMPRVVYAS